MANPPTPNEKRRKIGNPSGRPLPSLEETGTILPATDGLRAPEPPRPLGLAGREWWDRILTAGAVWIAVTDLEMAQQVAETIDEQQALRLKLYEPSYRKDAWRDRAQLRALFDQIRQGLNDLGFTPLARTRMGLAQVTAAAIASNADVRQRTAGKMFSDDGLTDGPPAPPEPDPKMLPYKSWTKARIVEWYEANSIEIPEGATKKELLELAGVAP